MTVPVPVGDQQIGDQVPAEHEEDIDPEEPPGKCGQLLVKGNNRDNSQGAQPIQPRPPCRGLIGCRAFHGMCRHCADPPGSQQCSRILARSMREETR